MKLTNHEFSLLYDNGAPLCFVGHTVYNKMLYNYWRDQRQCFLLSVEEAESQPQSWFDNHQFMCAVSNVAFKRFAVDKLSRFDPSYFSVIGTGNIFNNFTIGRGSYIQHYNDFSFGDGKVGDHCTVGSYMGFSHEVEVGDFCHISGYCFLNYATVHSGVVMPIWITVLGEPDSKIEIAEYCNFMINSTVTKSITETGTYLGNRKINNESSLTYKIL